MTPYYLYYHRHPESKQLVYVGIGTLDRAWQVNNRSKEHKEWLLALSEAGYLLTEIVSIEANGMPKSWALELELERIDKFRPMFNKNYSYPVKMNEEKYKQALNLRDEGLSYESIAAMLELSTMTIYRRLNGQTKHTF